MDRDKRMESEREMEAETGGASMTATEEEITSLNKRRKIRDSEIGCSPAKLLFSGVADSLGNSATSSLVMSGELSCGYVKSTDLKNSQTGEDFETVVSTFARGEFSSETSQSSELLGGDSTEAMDSSSSTTKKTSSPRKCCASEGMPSTAEIEEFFSVAEKSEQERFAKKYNYDIVKDVPLEGRYQWIPLKL